MDVRLIYDGSTIVPTKAIRQPGAALYQLAEYVRKGKLDKSKAVFHIDSEARSLLGETVGDAFDGIPFEVR